MTTFFKKYAENVLLQRQHTFNPSIPQCIPKNSFLSIATITGPSDIRKRIRLYGVISERNSVTPWKYFQIFFAIYDFLIHIHTQDHSNTYREFAVFCGSLPNAGENLPDSIFLVPFVLSGISFQIQLVSFLLLV